MATQPAVTTGAQIMPREIRIVAHSNLVYWWPVWVVGFLLGFVSLFSGYQLAAVPHGTVEGKLTDDAIVHPGTWNADKKVLDFDVNKTSKIHKGQIVLYADKDSRHEPMPPTVGITTSKGPGVIFCTILLVVIVITNIHLRGVWSFVVIVIIVFTVVTLSLAGAMDWILTTLSFLDVRISTGGYFLISAVLLILWLIIFFLFDPQTYIEFTPGQFRVKLEIGEGVTAYDTRGMTVRKERSDFFRQWVLGLGSGDLVVKTTGAQAHEVNLPNVLFVSQKVKVIEDMIAGAGR